MKTAPNNTFTKAKRRGYICCIMGNFPKKEGACPKMEINTGDYKKSLIDYKSHI
jgi:hypothetical protein